MIVFPNNAFFKQHLRVISENIFRGELILQFISGVCFFFFFSSSSSSSSSSWCR